jgi:hypothetical protein
MADLELASTCGRPDIAAYATRLSAEMHAAATASLVGTPDDRQVSHRRRSPTLYIALGPCHERP